MKKRFPSIFVPNANKTGKPHLRRCSGVVQTIDKVGTSLPGCNEGAQLLHFIIRSGGAGFACFARHCSNYFGEADRKRQCRRREERLECRFLCHFSYALRCSAAQKRRFRATIQELPALSRQRRRYDRNAQHYKKMTLPMKVRFSEISSQGIKKTFLMP